MGKAKRALSIRSIRSAAKKSKNAEPGLDAMWTTVGWLIPAQVVGLLVADVGFWLSLITALGIAVGLAVVTPISAGVVSAFTEKPTADRFTWLAMIAVAGAAWYAMAGPVMAFLLAGLGMLVFGIYDPRYRARESRQVYGAALPPELAKDIAALPKKLASSIRERIDLALASVESLHSLQSELPEGDALWTDAMACLRRIVERSKTVVRLRALPQRSPDIDRAHQTIEDELDDLAAQLSAAVDAASRFIAVGPSTAREELAERAEALHALAEATQEVEDVLS